MRYSIVLASILLAGAVVKAELPKDASTDQVLDALHDRGKDLTSLAADVKLSQSDDIDPDGTVRTGKLVLLRAADGETKVRINFTKSQRGQKVFDARRDIVLDGGTLIDREYQPKKQTTSLLPRKEGEKFDLFKLGEGPFPLPIGQTKEQVKKEFAVQPAKVETPTAGLIYVELTPIAGTQSAEKFKRIVVGVRSDGWPVEVESSDPKEIETTTATLSNIRANDAVSADEFKLEPIDNSWQQIERKL